jgi:hypothetical protein
LVTTRPRYRRVPRRASRSAIDMPGLTLFAIAIVILAALAGLLSAHAP